MKQYRVSKNKIQKDKGFLYFLDKAGYVAKAAMRGKKGGVMRIGTEKVKREPGWLYFIDKQGYVARVKMARRKRRG